MRRLGFAPQTPYLIGQYDAEPTAGDFDPGEGLSIATRTNDLATAAEGWHAMPYVPGARGGIGWGGAAKIAQGGSFDTSGWDDAPGVGGLFSFSGRAPSGSSGGGNLAGMGNDSPSTPVMSSGGNGQSAAMNADAAAMPGNNPIMTIALVVVGVWAIVAIYRTARGHDGKMSVGATFVLIDVPLIIAAVWGWRWVTGAAVSHGVPGAAQAAAFFAA